MTAANFTEYVLEKANDVISISHELEIEFIDLEGPVEAFIDDAVAAYRKYLVDLVASLPDESRF